MQIFFHIQNWVDRKPLFRFSFVIEKAPYSLIIFGKLCWWMLEVVKVKPPHTWLKIPIYFDLKQPSCPNGPSGVKLKSYANHNANHNIRSKFSLKRTYLILISLFSFWLSAAAILERSFCQFSKQHLSRSQLPLMGSILFFLKLDEENCEFYLKFKPT